MSLDFSSLSDDQIIGLFRAIMQEIACRGQDAQSAAKHVFLSEDEKIKIAHAATEREAAKLRALERQRVAEEAATKVRLEAARTQSESDKARKEALATAADEAAKAKAAQFAAVENAKLDWLSRAAELVGEKPSRICLGAVDGAYGKRVLINGGSCRYSRQHLVDYDIENNTIKTTRKLVQQKPALVQFCAGYVAWYLLEPSIKYLKETWIGADE